MFKRFKIIKSRDQVLQITGRFDLDVGIGRQFSEEFETEDEVRTRCAELGYELIGISGLLWDYKDIDFTAKGDMRVFAKVDTYYEDSDRNYLYENKDDNPLTAGLLIGILSKYDKDTIIDLERSTLWSVFEFKPTGQLRIE